MNKSIETKRTREKAMVSEMIALYCRKNHRTKSLYPDCAALADYARRRSDQCPFMEAKTFCSNCAVHCYAPEMREKIRAVMRFSGPAGRQRKDAGGNRLFGGNDPGGKKAPILCAPALFGAGCDQATLCRGIL